MDGSPASGMGLPNMRARAQTLPDGQFEIGRSDLGGARIRIGLRTHDMGSA
jgi:signal transduction histidine kinase